MRTSSSRRNASITTNICIRKSPQQRSRDSFSLRISYGLTGDFARNGSGDNNFFSLGFLRKFYACVLKTVACKVCTLVFFVT